MQAHKSVLLVVVCLFVPIFALSGSKLAVHTSFTGGGPGTWNVIQTGKPRLVKLLDSFENAAKIKQVGVRCRYLFSNRLNRSGYYNRWEDISGRSTYRRRSCGCCTELVESTQTDHYGFSSTSDIVQQCLTLLLRLSTIGKDTMSLILVRFNG